jgi:hypothetical protein
MFRSMLAVCLLLSGNVAAQQQQAKEPEFPTTEEIQLVVTQSERSIEQYRQSVVLESGLVSAKEDPSGVTKDQGVIESATKLIAALKKNPEGFHGLGGLLLLSLLDDASRNAALCSNAGIAEITQGLIAKPDANTAYRILNISNSCMNASTHLYTVSESVEALLEREMKAQQHLNDRAMKLANECTAVMKRMTPKDGSNR